MKKKFAKVGDKIRIVAADYSFDYYQNGDVLKVVGKDEDNKLVHAFTDTVGSFPVYHTEYEIVEDEQQGEFIFTEEHVGMEVWDAIYGKCKIESVSEADDEVYVLIDDQVGLQYTTKGYLYNADVRTLYFSEPKVTIEAERFPPKKPFVPVLKEGDGVVAWFEDGSKYFITIREETATAVIDDNGDSFFKSEVRFLKIGEEIKF